MMCLGCIGQLTQWFKSAAVLLLLSGLSFSHLALSADLASQWKGNDPVLFSGLDDVDADDVEAISTETALLDIEILLLKSELAQENAQPEVLKGYLLQIPLENIDEDSMSRINDLRAYLSLSIHTQPSSSRFRFDASNIVVLLPLSDTYQKAGQAILEGIEAALPNVSLHIVDTAVYDSADELWELTKLYEPSFIFGPLRADFVKEFALIETGVPMLLLNHVDKLREVDVDRNEGGANLSTPVDAELKYPSQSEVKSDNIPSYIRSFSPNRLDDLDQLLARLVNKNYQHVMVVAANDVKSQRLKKYFHRAWSQLPFLDQFSLIEKDIEKRIDKTLYRALGEEASAIRRNWLQKTVATTLEGDKRSRKDVEVLISFAPHRISMQISPLLDFYHVSQMPHIWFPPYLPSVDVFSKSLPFWQNTQAILPAFQAGQMLQYQTLNRVPSKVGIFRALGEEAVHLAKEMTEGRTRQFMTPLGRVVLDASLNPIIHPAIYWLNNGKMIRIAR